MEKTNITADELRQMDNSEFLAHLRKFPYPSQWTDAKALAYANYHLALIQGARYAKTGSISSFKTTNLR